MIILLFVNITPYVLGKHKTNGHNISVKICFAILKDTKEFPKLLIPAPKPKIWLEIVCLSS